jgi:hypothetical protein
MNSDDDQWPKELEQFFIRFKKIGTVVIIFFAIH